MDMASITVGPAAREVHYFRAGSGAPLLFLHSVVGLPGFEPALALLAERFDVIAPYAPGFGPAKDQLPDIDEGPLDLTLHHADVLDAFGLERAHVVGVSIGAWMAAELAAILPRRVERLVLVNPLGIWRDDIGGEDPFAQHPGFPSRILFADKDGRQQHLFEGRDKMDAHVEELLNLRAAAKFLWPIPDTGVERRLARITAPSLVVTSAADVVVPAAYGPVWQASIGGARSADLGAAGHLADLDQPEAFARTVGDFLADESVAQVA
ncbi:MAG: alpha/beta fold hydrolase [Gammaproteobacteria bacterium]